MQRKTPSRQRAAGGSSAASSRGPQSEQKVNRLSDVPVEFREMLADNIRESRQVPPPAAPPAAETPPKRKKPLTRDRRPTEHKPESNAESSRGHVSAPPTTRKGNEISKAFTSGVSPSSKPYSRELAKSPHDSSSRKQLLPGAHKSPLSNKSQAKAPAVESVQNFNSDDDEFEEEDEDEEDEDDEADWENVDLSAMKPKPQKSDEPIVFELSSNKTPTKDKNTGRTGPTPAERKIRLEVHKMHLLCLLSHVHRRSHYCNDEKVQDALLPILERRVIAELNDNSFQQSKVLKQGLSNAAAAFRRRYKITRPGVRKALWGNIPSSPSALYGDLPMGIDEFRDAAKKLQGTRDLAAQLFCALIRGTGLDARLVCSLQPLSYLFKAKYSIEESKRTGMKLIEEDPDDYNTSEEDTSTGGFVGNINKAFGGPGLANFRHAPVAPIRTYDGLTGPPKQNKKKEKQMLIHDPALPTYWVEVFDVMNQSWIPVDPMEMGVVRNYNNFEPSQADAWENEMSYVVGFDKFNKVRDITRKYVKAYNSYTRTLRVEATLDGKRWWRKALKPFTVSVYFAPDRDQVEDGLMDDKLLREGIPKSLSAMKNHPVFAIEEQLRQDEVIHPKKECGKMVGKAKKTIPVYRRQDVKKVKTATQWYMQGREITAGEQPLKRKKLRRRRARNLDEIDPEDMDEMEEEEAGMYALNQTIVYRAEPCLGPMVPKNAYGNIDLYVPSMLPEGGVHIPHKKARAAADALGIGDYVADAITGFDFRTAGRSMPVIRGIVAAEENEEAIWTMIDHMEREEKEEADEKRRIKNLNMWRRFLIGLRIKERVDDYALDDEEYERPRIMEDEDEDDGPQNSDESELEDSGGGFVRGQSGSEPDPEFQGGGGFFTNDLEELAGNAMRFEIQRKEFERIARELENARARMAKIIESQDSTRIAENLYDPNAFESGGGFFLEGSVSELPRQFKDDGKAGLKRKANEAVDSGGGFFVDDSAEEERPGKRSRTSTPSHPNRGLQSMEEDCAFSGGGGFLIEEEEEAEQDLMPTKPELPKPKRKLEHAEDGAERPRKRSRSISPSEDSSKLSTGQDEIQKKADKQAERESQQEEARRIGDQLAEKLAKGEDVEIPENLGNDDDVLSDEFEYEDAGWASD